MCLKLFGRLVSTRLNNVANKCLEDINARNKLIKLADTSECGWDTANCYMTNSLASDSDDEKKINKAEVRTLKKKKEKQANFKKQRGRGGYGVVPVQIAMAVSWLWLVSCLGLPILPKISTDSSFFVAQGTGDGQQGRASVVANSGISGGTVHSPRTSANSMDLLPERSEATNRKDKTQDLVVDKYQNPVVVHKEVNIDLCVYVGTDTGTDTGPDIDLGLTNHYFEYEQGEKEILVKGRLKSNRVLEIYRG